MEVHLIRHTSVAVEKGTYYGQTDVPLAESFQEEAEAYQASLPQDFDMVFCSPMKRCVQLAESVHSNFENQDIPLKMDDRLKELYFGEWEGKKWTEMDQKIFYAWMEDFVNINTPSGENLNDLFLRCKSFLDELSQQNYQKVLLVSHAGFIRCTWAYLLEVPLENIFKIPVAFGETMVFNLSSNRTDNYLIRKK
ncbi:alpha-ribazole phosphatase [Chondrinema litorale]|uniref:alpha-ribazole phosphatase n=1 Tax=Chondrinema litorale TaxID=2994555 RepID=UPI0025428716|nr:alpha-ribazole phosphatase [Chondrinema litorale]UZR99674.1 alpha-ribazole phosphatase [Chondrinema litorale]